MPSASLKLLNLNQDHPSKKWLFWSNSITSHIELLGLTNHIHDKTTFIQNTLISRRPRVVIFAGNIKIVTKFIKAIFEDSKKSYKN